VNSSLQKYSCELLKATNDDGCNVIGYTVWTLMDDFEWWSVYKYVLFIFYMSLLTLNSK